MIYSNLSCSILFSIFITVMLAACDSKAEDKSKNQVSTETLVPSYAVVFSTEASFEDAKEDLLDSIQSQGLVINSTSDAKTMLANTAEVSGVTLPVYNNAEILSFCKADLSHALVAANPHNLVLCPYTLAIYVIRAEPEKVYISFRELEGTEAATKPIRKLLIKIIEEVI